MCKRWVHFLMVAGAAIFDFCCQSQFIINTDDSFITDTCQLIEILMGLKKTGSGRNPGKSF